MRRSLLAFALSVPLLATACAPVAPVATPPLGPAEVEHVGALIEAEDRRGDPAAAIAAGLEHPHPAVRRQAALGAGRLMAAEHAPVLVGLLSDPDTTVAATAAFALGRLGDTTVVESLAASLDPRTVLERPTVAKESVSALARLGTESGRIATIALLRESAGRRAAESEVAKAALLALWRFDQPVDPSDVRRWLNHRDAEIRWRAAYALARRPNPAATADLLQAVDDAEPLVRFLALRGLTAALADSAGISRQESRGAVIDALDDDDPRVRVQAARTLGSYGAEGAAPLALAAADPEPHVVIAVAEGLGRAGSPEAERALIDLLDHGELQVRMTAFESLVATYPRQARERAAAFAGSDDWRERAAVARTLAVFDGQTGGSRQQSEALLRDRDPRVVAAAVSSIAEVPATADRWVHRQLLAATGSGDAAVRAAAFTGLGRIGGPELLPVLLDGFAAALDDPHPRAALAALDALHALETGGTPVLRSLLRRVPTVDEPLVRQRAVAHFGSPARRTWGDAFPTDPPRPPEAYRALARDYLATGAAGDVRVHIETERGTISLTLFAAEAPLTVENFIRLAEAGYFDGQEWPRVVPAFVIQGGDPRGDTSGGPGYAIRDEINRHRYDRGTLGMALSGPDTGGSQFFITHAPQPHLDGDYTVFGRVDAGMEVVDRVTVGERIHRVVVERE